MSRRTPMVRFITLLLAMVQLASPGLSAIADGLVERDNASGPVTHVEATTTAACPVVHHPECGVCRYLSIAASPSRTPAPSAGRSAAGPKPRAESRESRAASRAAPNGRAPPPLSV